MEDLIIAINFYCLIQGYFRMGEENKNPNSHQDENNFANVGGRGASA